MTDLLWSWTLTIVGATCFYLAGGLNGRKVWWAWYIGLFAQVLWATYAFLDLETRMGFLVGVVLYGFVYVRNCVNWTREHLEAKQAARQHAALVSRIIGKIDEQRETPEGIAIRGRLEPTEIPARYGSRYLRGVTPRRLVPQELPARRDLQCKFSWFSQAYGYVRCEHDFVAVHDRHEAENPATFVAVGYEESVEYGSWTR